ncbi:hypothetical protein Slin15195_G070620 [Septoria linicola]|uniref:Retrovirus-related Pol polyprotein from transposon TNT 1-94-like beta-barrel domain-containing protein n=1 Tax=Septoria linicola TaxID=215465 RepID=A0A9Q9AX79_9PEZI|nr:hypothetical protein Slin15195_G070620 [Septoria linicola]
MAPTGVPYHIDWIWSNNSNVHVANHRDWFTTYTELKTHTGSIYTGDQNSVDVLGVGDVELVLQTSKTDPTASATVVLRDVLYCPSNTCNIFGHPILQDYGLITSKHDSRLLDKETGASAGLLDLGRLWRLRLVGHSATETSLSSNGIYMINAAWSEAERARWLAVKNQMSTALPPSTEEEKSWLKKHYGNEWKFLASHGLNLTKDDQRAEGHAILEAVMNDEE